MCAYVFGGVLRQFDVVRKGVAWGSQRSALVLVMAVGAIHRTMAVMLATGMLVQVPVVAVVVAMLFLETGRHAIVVLVGGYDGGVDWGVEGGGVCGWRGEGECGSDRAEGGQAFGFTEQGGEEHVVLLRGIGRTSVPRQAGRVTGCRLGNTRVVIISVPQLFLVVNHFTKECAAEGDLGWGFENAGEGSCVQWQLS
jgi:hypothetical protein